MRDKLSLTAVFVAILSIAIGNLAWLGLGHGTFSAMEEHLFWSAIGVFMVYMNSLIMDRE